MSSAPAYQALGAVQAGTGGITVPWPSHLADDVALLFIETANETVSFTDAAGFAEVTNSPQGTGTAAGLSSTRLAVYWCRATSAAMASPVIPDLGNHVIAQIVTFRGCITTGNPWDVTAGDTLGAASTSVTIPSVTTTLANTLCVMAVANAQDSATDQTGAMTNANLTGITERADENTQSGNGGGFGVSCGVKVAAGVTGTTTCTLANSTVQGRMMIALKPVPDTTVSGAGTLRGTAERFVTTGLLFVSFANPLRVASPRLVGQATAPAGLATVDCVSTIRAASASLQSPAQTLSFATTPLRPTQARLVGNATVVGAVAGTSDLRGAHARLTAISTMVLRGAGTARFGSFRIASQSASMLAGASTLAGSSARLIGNATANLGFTPVDCVSDLRASERLSGLGATGLHTVSTLSASARLFSQARTILYSVGRIAQGELLNGQSYTTGDVNPPAINHKTLVLQRVNHGTGTIQHIHGSSVMDSLTADDTTHTADSTDLHADGAPMGFQA